MVRRSLGRNVRDSPQSVGRRIYSVHGWWDQTQGPPRVTHSHSHVIVTDRDPSARVYLGAGGHVLSLTAEPWPERRACQVPALAGKGLT